MSVRDLTLEEMFALEREHTASMGSRTSVFLEPAERAGPSGPVLPKEIGDAKGNAGRQQESQNVVSPAEVKEATHKLNNLLAVIQEHSGKLSSMPELPNEVSDSIQTIRSAAEHAAMVTRLIFWNRRKETILVVDEEPMLRNLAHSILENYGYNVLEAATGSEALRVWDRHRGDINLLVTDIVMPEGTSGVELAQRLRATKPQLKVIFVSDYASSQLDRDCPAPVLKPYTDAALLKAVRDCLNTELTSER